MKQILIQLFESCWCSKLDFQLSSILNEVNIAGLFANGQFDQQST